MRKWFSHEPSRWQEFRKRYKKELEEKGELLERLRSQAKKGSITLLFTAKDMEHNNAVVVKEVIEVGYL